MYQLSSIIRKKGSKTCSIKRSSDTDNLIKDEDEDNKRPPLSAPVVGASGVDEHPV